MSDTITEQPKRKYSWKPDVPDHNDHVFMLAGKIKASLPKVDPIGINNRIEDQSSLGSCTGNAASSATEIIIKTSRQLSRLQAYYNARMLEGNQTIDSGASIRSVIKGISKFGLASEAAWPYNIKKFAKPPSDRAARQALSILPKISKYQRIVSLNELKTALSNGLPVVFGFTVPESFEKEQMSIDGFLSLPVPGERSLGGHAVVAVGYDDTVEVPFVWIRNSWGANWGIAPEGSTQRGHFKMDQRYFTSNQRLVDDLWVIYPV